VLLVGIWGWNKWVLNLRKKVSHVKDLADFFFIFNQKTVNKHFKDSSPVRNSATYNKP
jgi:hypothetical protein